MLPGKKPPWRTAERLRDSCGKARRDGNFRLRGRALPSGGSIPEGARLRYPRRRGRSGGCSGETAENQRGSVVIKDIAFAAQTEREAAEALSRLTESRSARIGSVPCESDVYAALRNIGNIAYTSKVLLTGEYSQDGEVRAIPLDRAPEYKYFLPETGVHTVRIDGAAGI